MTAVRDAAEHEAAAIGELLSRAGFGPTVGGLVAFPADSPHGDVLVAERHERPVGAVCCASFGATGWIGALGVLPEARRRGVGQALTAAACERLRARGAETVLLFATDMGRPLYDRMGFVAEGNATAWRGTAGVARAGITLRSLRETDRPALAAIDERATGERRGAVLDELRPLQGLMAERDGEAAGFAVTSPWGAGVAICADVPEAGVALMAAAAGGPGAATMVVPDRNPAAAEALRRWDFTAAAAGERMRLGPPVAWRPEMQFGLFNLFWG
ncbi:MAG TPA: GNAT family N-acetyltransferase [Solirubrobacteraceae bacterium]|nr:GNAT family N-acetyltransferase [Solirubrobacteraceae bacterium]